MRYCTECGAPVTLTIPEGDNRERHVCTRCHYIHYSNPNIVAGCLPLLDNKVLLCLRDIEPRKGFWTLPAGFMENGETILEAAKRECLEEACADVDVPGQIYTSFDMPDINQVHIFFIAHLTSENGYGIGLESSDVQLFSLQDIPWENLAFQSVYRTLKYYCQDAQQQVFPMKMETIQKNNKRGFY